MCLGKNRIYGVIYVNWLRKFMLGRNGSDRLSIFLVIVALILTIIANLSKLTFIKYISFIILVLAIYRVLSKNIVKRRMENYKFVMFTSWGESQYKKITNRIRDSKTHKYFSCPDCKATLRLPKGKGKIMITCPKCKKEFMRKT